MCVHSFLPVFVWYMLSQRWRVPLCKFRFLSVMKLHFGRTGSVELGCCSLDENTHVVWQLSLMHFYWKWWFYVSWEKATMHFWLPRPWTSSPPASSPLSGSSQLREAPGNHMLSQLGLPASNRDTLTLIHSTGEVLSLARRRESTNTETFTLHQIDSAAYNPLPPPPASHLSLSAPPITICYSCSLSPPLKEQFSLKHRPGRCHFYFYCCLFDCVSSSSPFSAPPSVNISLCSSASLILSLHFLQCQCSYCFSQTLCSKNKKKSD